jgi:hypothetical protein
MVSAILGRPMIYFLYAIYFANLSCAVLLFIQLRTNRALKNRADRP